MKTNKLLGWMSPSYASTFSGRDYDYLITGLCVGLGGESIYGFSIMIILSLVFIGPFFGKNVLACLT